MNSILRSANTKVFAKIQATKGTFVHPASRIRRTLSHSQSINDDSIDTYDPIVHIPLIFLRHGQSTWNQQNIFIGMNDTPLTTNGMHEARIAGSMLAADHVKPDIVYTSLLRRATKTAWIVMQEMGMEWVPVVKDWRLNERNYGALVGRNKKQAVEEFGEEKVKRWRRSWDVPPPPMSSDSPHWPGKDPRYKTLGIDMSCIPPSESLADVTKRTKLFWEEVIVRDLKKDKKIVIVGHENNLRSLVMQLDDVSKEDIVHVELPRAIPLLYYLDKKTLKPVKIRGAAPYLRGRYLADEKELKKIQERDYKQVYDLSTKENLEIKNPFVGLGFGISEL